MGQTRFGRIAAGRPVAVSTRFESCQFLARRRNGLHIDRRAGNFCHARGGIIVKFKVERTHHHPMHAIGGDDIEQLDDLFVAEMALQCRKGRIFDQVARDKFVDPATPYHHEHVIASAVERVAAILLFARWSAYNETLERDSLLMLPRKRLAQDRESLSRTAWCPDPRLSTASLPIAAMSRRFLFALASACPLFFYPALPPDKFH